MSRFVGIDFSGGAPPWRRSVGRPTVWIAVIEGSNEKRQLVELTPVQWLDGNEAPYDRLAKFLAAGDFEAAGIDAPFSLPLAHMPRGGHSELLRQIGSLPNGSDRPFPLGASIVALGEAVAPKVQAKPLRPTDAFWTSKGVNTRSTMWNGPRGGAPFAAACLRLLERSGRPCWPWRITAVRCSCNRSTCLHRISINRSIFAVSLSRKETIASCSEPIPQTKCSISFLASRASP